MATSGERQQGKAKGLRKGKAGQGLRSKGRIKPARIKQYKQRQGMNKRQSIHRAGLEKQRQSTRRALNKAKGRAVGRIAKKGLTNAKKRNKMGTAFLSYVI